MAHQIQVAETARREIAEAYRWYSERTLHADAWLDGLWEAIDSLQEHPERCPLTEDSHIVGGFELRELLYRKSWRIFYEVHAGVVVVTYVRHARRASLD